MGHLDIKMLSYQYQNPHYKDKMVSWLCYSQKGIQSLEKTLTLDLNHYNKVYPFNLYISGWFPSVWETPPSLLLLSHRNSSSLVVVIAWYLFSANHSFETLLTAQLAPLYILFQIWFWKCFSQKNVVTILFRSLSFVGVFYFALFSV